MLAVFSHRHGHQIRTVMGDIHWQDELRRGWTAAGQGSSGHRVKPRVFVTDGLRPFCKAFKKIFWSGRGPRPVHVADSHWTKKYCSSNNGHERFNGKLGDVLNGVRGIKKRKSPLFKLLIVHHNFIKPHFGLGGMTPAKAAGITINGTPWRTLIACAAVHEALAAA